MPTTRQNKMQLAERYSDPAWQQKLIDVLDLSSFLANCIIRSGYKVPDSINSIVPLSNEGSRVFRELTRQSVPAKEARLLCLLDMLHVDPLIEVDQINVTDLAAFIGDQIKDSTILLPNAWGPTLYMKMAETFQDEQRSLDHEKTLRLLEGTGTGVFQAGFWLSGPLGILKSLERRSNMVTRRIPLQHCHDLSCNRVHDVRLETASGASINQNRHKIEQLLEKKSDVGWDWSGYLTDLLRDKAAQYDDQDLATLSIVVSDAFADGELRRVLRQIMDGTSGGFRNHMKELGIPGGAECSGKVADRLRRDELLQLILLSSDMAILTAIDNLTLQGIILVPPGEIRKSPLRDNWRSGAFGSSVQISQYGLRVDTIIATPPLRLRRLVDLMYPASDPDGQRELDWQLRSIEGASVAARLDEYLRTAVPSQAIRTLALARPKNLEVACEHLRLNPDLLDTDDKIVACILWKLGFEVPPDFDLRDSFWMAHEKVTHAARAASVSAIIDEESLRGTAANYFIEVERLLQDSLVFATWTLLTDHIEEQNPFSYDDSSARDESFALLNEYLNKTARPDEHDQFTFDDKVTLYPLSRGFAILGKLLRELQLTESSCRRPLEEFPDFASHTSLQKFPFNHRSVFLDLTEASQLEINDLLDQVSKHLLAGKVSDVRNEQLHFRRSRVDLDRLIECLASVEKAVRLLDDAGLTRVLYSEKRRESDLWGRSTAFMVDRNGREIAFARPNSFRWLQLPSLETPQYIIACAQFADPNEPLRISPRLSSAYTKLWTAFPRRPRASAQLVSSDGTPAPSPVNLGGSSSQF